MSVEHAPAPVTVRCADKIPYLSEMCAANAVWLHQVRFPDCPGIAAYACGDHHHVGHPTKAAREACAAAQTPRPRHRPMHRQRRRP